MYAVVAPGFSCIYTNWKDVERIKALYPYPKWCKCNSEEEARKWIDRNSYGKMLRSIYNYGNTFKNLYIDAKYQISTDCVYYILDCKRIGKLRIPADGILVEYRGSKIYIKLPNIRLSNESIAGHMSAVHNLLQMIGPYVDINLEVPYYSIYYCLAVYSRGNNRYVSMVRSLIDQRVGAVGVTLKLNNIISKEEE